MVKIKPTIKLNQAQYQQGSLQCCNVVWSILEIVSEIGVVLLRVQTQNRVFFKFDSTLKVDLSQLPKP